MGLGATIKASSGSSDELGEAAWVEVHERMGEPTTYRARFEIDIGKGDISRLTAKELDVGTDLTITTSVGGKKSCLVKGPVHGQRIRLAHGGSGSTLEVCGTDSSIKMDRQARTHQWKESDSDVVQSIVKGYGFSTDISSTDAKHEEDKHTLVQRESDLGFVRRLARRNGCLFWITCDEKGSTETAHFKRAPLDGSSTAKLSINVKTPSIHELHIEWDAERPTSFEATQLTLEKKEKIDASKKKMPLRALGDSDLKAITNDTRSMYLVAPADEAGELGARSDGALIESSWFIRASCETNVQALGAIVRAHTIVELEGAGKRHSGKYFVAGVKHTIDPVLHKMDIELVRNAWSK